MSRQEREGTKLSEEARFAFSSSGANLAFIETLCWERGEPRTGALEQNGNGTKRHAGESDRATNIQRINAQISSFASGRFCGYVWRQREKRKVDDV